MVATTTLPPTARSPHRVAHVAAEAIAGLALLGAAFVAGRATVDEPADRIAPTVTADVADAGLSFCHTNIPC